MNVKAYLFGVLVLCVAIVGTSEATSVFFDQDMEYNFLFDDHKHGEMWFHNDESNVTTTISSQGVWVNLTGFDTGEATGQTLNGFTYFTDTLVAQVSGRYDVDYSLSFGNVGNNQEYQMHITVNGIHQNNTDAHRKVGSAGDVGNSGSGGFVDLSAGDQVNLHIRNNDGTGDVVSHAANVKLVKIGEI